MPETPGTPGTPDFAPLKAALDDVAKATTPLWVALGEAAKEFAQVAAALTQPPKTTESDKCS